MRWNFWQRKDREEAQAEIRQAQQETQEARRRLRQIERDDVRLGVLTDRTRRAMIENNFAADIRKALGGGAR